MVSLEKILSRGYFPKELPPPFSTASFGDFIKRNPTVVPILLTASKQSRLARHSLARAGTLRRHLGVPNPISFLGLANCLTANWSKVLRYCRKSIISLSKLDTSSVERSVVTKVPFSDHPIHQAELRSSSKFVLKTDVANWYSSIYTHSIPWALHTKAKAKTTRSPKALLGNELDKLLCDSQYGQTAGIPIGPDTSFAIGEMLLATVDAVFCSRMSKRGVRVNGFRSYDDFEFGFDNRADAETAIALLQEVLSEFELQLNPSKTTILELPMPLEATWVSEIRTFLLRGKPNVWDINRYFDRAFELSKQFPDSEVLKYSIQRFREVDVTIDYWPHLENLLLQCAMVEPSCLSAVVDQLHYYKKVLGYPLGNGNIQRVLNLLLKLHAPLGHGSEVAWALWGCLLFEAKVDEQLSMAVAQMEDPFVMLLLLHARSVGLTVSRLDTRSWRRALSASSLYEELWPFAYEANIKGWMATGIDYVTGDAAFSHLKAGNVSFYDANKVTTHIPSKRRAVPLSPSGGYPVR